MKQREGTLMNDTMTAIDRKYVKAHAKFMSSAERTQNCRDDKGETSCLNCDKRKVCRKLDILIENEKSMKEYKQSATKKAKDYVYRINNHE